MKNSESMPAVFAGYDRIRIINLAHRADRRAEVKQQLRRVGLGDDPRVEFFPAISPSDAGQFSNRGAYGCFLSHRAVLEQAASSGQSVLILEDDCDFRLPEIANYFLPTQCDIFYGGFIAASNPENLQESDIIGSHFMGFSANAAHVATNYLRRYTGANFAPDPRAAAQSSYNPAIRPPVDGAFVWLRRAHPELVTVFAHLSVQRASRTDIGDLRLFDRMPLVRDVAQLARRLRRLIRPITSTGKASFGISDGRD